MNIKRRNFTDNIIYFFVWLGIILIPFDSVPIFNSEYRPVSVIPFCIAFIFVLPKVIVKKVKKLTVVLLILGGYSICFSYIYSRYVYNEYTGFFQFSITFILGIIAFMVCDYVFEKANANINNNNEYLNFFFKISVNKVIYTFIIIIGIIQILNLKHIVPDQYVQVVGKVFSGSQRNDRVKLFSSEPSWASMQLTYILPILFYLKDKYKKSFYYFAFYACAILFFATFSVQGFIIMAIAFFIFIVINSRSKILSIIKILLVAILFFFCFQILLMIGKKFWSGAYFLNHFNILENLGSWDRFYNFLLTDSSAYVRVMLPVAGIMMFFNKPIFGIGGGNYKFEFENIITKYFPDGFKNREIYSYINNRTANCRNLYIRILCEMGIIGAVIFIIFISKILKKIKFVSNSYNKKVLIFWISSVLCLFLQFDSLAYVNLWVALAFVNNLRGKSIYSKY